MPQKFGSKWVVNLGLILAICIASTVAHFAGIGGLDDLLQAGMVNPTYIYIAGCLSGAVLVPILTYALKKTARYLFSHKDEADHALYRLDHGVLNVEIPPRTMWMNLGYWKQASTFPAACRALLNEVLVSAGILESDGIPSASSNASNLTLIDLGFGCGDQIIYLTQILRGTTAKQIVDSANDEPMASLFDIYVGISISPSQFTFACERLHSYSNHDKTKVRLFCADAANPDSWSNDIHEAMTNLPAQRRETNHASSSLERTTWVLALDSLYHFIPSRELIFHHAFEELKASIMAFDILLSDKPSIKDLILLRIVALFTGIPFSNFLTIAQYKSQLLAAGYESSRIDIQDISEHVFDGMSSFMETRDRELKYIGMDIGRFRVAGKVFKWWAQTGIVRGCIIVAKR